MPFMFNWSMVLECRGGSGGACATGGEGGDCGEVGIVWKLSEKDECEVEGDEE